MSAPLRIIMLEDSPEDAELNERALRAGGLEFVSERVETRDGFRRAIVDYRPDVILADYRLPGFDGRAALQLVRELAPHVPTILVTGSTSEETAVECMKAGAADYVLKQNLSALVPAVRTALERMKLVASEARFLAMANSAPLAIITAARDGRVLSWNAAAGNMFGHTEAEMVGHSLDILMPERYREAHETAMASFSSAGRRGVVGTTRQLEGLRKDGSEFPMEISLSYWMSPEGACFAGIIQDVSQRVEAEEALRTTNEAYQSLVEHAVHGIYRSTPEGRFLAVNPAFVAMLGYESTEEVLSLDMARDVYLHPEERNGLVERYSATPLRGLEVEWKRKNGSPLTVRLSGYQKRGSDGEVETFDVIAEDVTERRSLELQLLQAQKMEAVGRLAGGVAHDFNNLLTVILGEGELALEENPDPAARSALVAIVDASERAVHLIRQLLTFSRKQPVALTAFDPNVLVHEVVAMTRRLVEENITVSVGTGVDTGTILGDRGQVEQVLMNLVVNARDAMPAGGTLRFASSNATLDEEFVESNPGVVPGEYVLLSVRDTGSGMSEETMLHAFEPFFSTKGEGGTGLGLATCYGIVKRHDGHIAVRSESGLGTTVEVYLPCVSTDAGAPTVESFGTAGTRAGSECILVVEDDDAVRSVAVGWLQLLGYRVLDAATGEEALHIVEEGGNSVDLLFADVVLPGLSGRELAEHVQRIDPQTRVLLCSGYGTEGVVGRGPPQHEFELLKKPFRIAELARRVRRVLDDGAGEPAAGGTGV